ncbi:hypothetical protein [Flavobacterium psychrotrophum]|uniref:hypothetical protein n=1 Tax=Flavobacterium psychrotrophum TaxID=2294119 RepID=UPI001F08D692|nr:hypothetical protein [Flavobacterium psychrotrophum]
MNPLSAFFHRSVNDQRVSTTHIGIFAALVQYSTDRGSLNPYRAYSHEIMAIAKVSALRTYSKCMQELDAYGYLRYEASKKKNLPSKIFFLNT